MAQIAAIPVVAYVNGQRQIIPAGAEIPPDVPAHDVRALLATGALRDDDAASAAHAREQARRKAADEPFNAAREAARLAEQSIAPPAPTAQTASETASQTGDANADAATGTPTPQPPASARRAAKK